MKTKLRIKTKDGRTHMLTNPKGIGLPYTVAVTGDNNECINRDQIKSMRFVK
jgi:hypothetical protein